MFGAGVTTQYGTTLIGAINYVWSIGGSSGTFPSAAAITYTFYNPDNYTVSLNVIQSGNLIHAPTLNASVLGEW